MNKQQLISEHQNTKQAIEKNLDAIKALVQEIQDIQKVIKTLESTNNNQESIKILQQSVIHINKSIETLLEQTDKLFESHKNILHMTFIK
jgi:predicted lipoprotein